MQGYGEGFAAIYNMRWHQFAREAAPRILSLYEKTPLHRHCTNVLDIACGSGQLALHFLDHGYSVVGLDLSPAMLAHATANARDHEGHNYIAEGRARFVEGDAADFAFDERFGLVISTFDALNHLPDMVALKGCFRSTYGVLEPGGLFVFDLNTRFGLSRWAGINVQEEEDLVLITRGVVAEEEGRAYTQISGFLLQEDGRYTRFGEVAYNTIFDMAEVATALTEAGFGSVTFAAPQALETPLDEPEDYGRVFIIAQKLEG